MARFLDFEGVDAVVFDCDGVLLDSEPLSERAWRRTLDGYGAQLDGEFAGWVGKTDLEIAMLHASAVGVEPDRLVHEMSASLLALLGEEGVEAFPDARRALDRALRAGLATAIATNSQRWRLEALLSSAGLSDLARATVTSDDVSRPKPAPDIYQLAAELLETEPSRCLAVEDSPTGIAAARSAGMRVVAVRRGTFADSQLAPATKVVPNLDAAVG